MQTFNIIILLKNNTNSDFFIDFTQQYNKNTGFKSIQANILFSHIHF